MATIASMKFEVRENTSSYVVEAHVKAQTYRSN